MSPQAVVEDFLAAWNRLDMDRVFSLMHPDVFYHNIPMAPAHGHDGVRAVFAGFPPFDAAEWTVHAIAANGQIVLTERTDRFRMAGKWLAIRVMGTFEVQGGLITQWRDYFDMAEFTTQLAILG
jgi:limonene-1,2-epoxide hydrolase